LSFSTGYWLNWVEVKGFVTDQADEAIEAFQTAAEKVLDVGYVSLKRLELGTVTLSAPSVERALTRKVPRWCSSSRDSTLTGRSRKSTFKTGLSRIALSCSEVGRWRSPTNARREDEAATPAKRADLRKERRDDGIRRGYLGAQYGLFLGFSQAGPGAGGHFPGR